MSRARCAWLCLVLLFACEVRLCGPSYLAELKEREGQVQRDAAQAVGAWTEADRGARFQVGDGLRTGDHSRAQLALASDGVALVEPNTVLRFLDRDPRGQERRMSVEEGSVQVDSGELALDVQTPRALARLEQGARVRIVAGPHALQLDVLVGRVAIEHDDTATTLSAGEHLALSAPPEMPSPPPPRVDDDAAPDASVRPDLPEPILPELAPATLHASALPVTLRVTMPACPEPTKVELDGLTVGSAEGAISPVLRLSRLGAHRVRLRCQRRVVRDTLLRVARDSATEELPHSAQRIDIEADGRRYTVRYQNVVPVVNVQWSAAQAARGYTLTLRRGRRQRQFRAPKPRYEIPTAELAEGNYEFWFTSAKGQRSEVGVLRVEFDNTARSLTLTEPREGADAGDVVQVSGMALLRSRVSVNGTPVALDGKGRFAAQLTLAGHKHVLVRAQHPAAGLHYYLRRLR